jgi:hypothetical protein
MVDRKSLRGFIKRGQGRLQGFRQGQGFLNLGLDDAILIGGYDEGRQDTDNRHDDHQFKQGKRAR